MASRGVVCLFLLWFVPFFFSLRSLEFLFLSLCWWDGQSTACSHRTVFYFERGVGRTHSLFCSERKCLWVRIYSISDSGHCCSQVSWPPLFDVSPFGFLTEPNFVWPSFHFCLPHSSPRSYVLTMWLLTGVQELRLLRKLRSRILGIPRWYGDDPWDRIG
jgi:hypothetical protein